MFKKKTDKNEKIKEKARKEEARATAMYEDYESKKNSSEPKEVKGLLRSVPVILCAVALFIILCFITGETGAFGEFISSTLKGLFSYVAYTIPAFIVVHAIFFISDLERKKLLQRLAVSLILLVTLAELAYLIPNLSSELTLDAAKFYNDGIEGIGGGFIGSVIGYGIQKIVGKAGLIIIVALTFFLCGLFFFAGWSEQIYASFLKKLAGIANYFAMLESARQEKKKRSADAKEEKKRAAHSKKNVDFLDDDFFDTRNGLSELSIPELGINEVKEKAKTEAAFNLKESVSASDKKEEPTRRIFTDFGIPKDEPTDKKTDKASSYRPDDIVVEVSDEPEADAEDPFANIDLSFSKEQEQTSFSKGFKAEESAESIFSGSFDPYDIAVNERLATKRSSKADEYSSARTSFSEQISELTPESVEKMRRTAELEARRQEALRRKAERESAEAAKEVQLSISEKDEPEVEKSELYVDESVAEKESSTPFENTEYTEEKSGYTFSASEPTDYAAKKASSYRYTTIAEVADAYEDIMPREAARNPKTSAFRFVGEAAREQTVIAESTSVSGATAKNEIIEEKIPEPLNFNVNTAGFEKVAGEQGNPESPKTLDFIFEEEEYIEPVIKSSEPEPSTISVNRASLEPDISSLSGLDFTFDDDEDEHVEGEAEETVEKTEIPPEEQNEKLYEYQKMYDIFSTPKDTGNATACAEDVLEGSPESASSPKQHTNTDDNGSGLNCEAEASAENEVISEDLCVDDSSSTQEQIYEDITEDSINNVDDEESDGCNDQDIELDDAFDDDDLPFDPDEKDNTPVKERPDYSDYKFPPIDFLKKGVIEDPEGINEEIQESGDKLISTLESFNIKATIRGIERGPRITRYSIVPARGVRVNQIEKRSDDIALALAAESIRIEAPIPGKAAVGVEVPNKISSIVSLRDLIDSEEFNNDKSSTAVCIGKSIEGTNVFGNISSMPHLLIAGATGMGKSVCINSLITSILYKARPDEVKFIMIDPKKVEFAPYDGIPHLLVPVVTEVKQAAGVLMWAVDEMNKRYDSIQHAGVRTVDAYNEKLKLHPELGQFMPKIVIFIDELNDLMITVRDPVEGLITLIAQKARAAGIHLVIGTQRPSVNVITGVIKANIPSRIACKVSSGIDSRTILEQIGAERLIGKGDMLFAPGGKPNPIRVQGAYVSDQETENIVNFIKAQAKGDVYDAEAMEDIRKAAQKCDKSKNGGSDDDYDDEGEEGVGYLRDRKFIAAVELAIRHGSIATSYLQRKLRIGYAKAAQYIDIMEDLGVVGEKDGSKPRDVLISMQEWNEKLSRLTDD